ncbi:MAG: discoidin domain-containing protein [Actinomycetota bacterium]|nr:discoidin domain-containing protein [Actinomycetota bacterium]MDK1095993.1 discoidin domain-containing protein [Actinomycetota bacterium]
MQGDDRNDQFDELFEPFELGDAPSVEDSGDPATESGVDPFDPMSAASQPHQTNEQPISQEHVATSADIGDTIGCPSCGARNPTFNHHCERCGSRLSQDPMPIATAPAARASAGSRALGVLAAVVLLVALLALVTTIFRGDDAEVAIPGPEPTETTTTKPPIITELTAVSATASSQVADSFGPENLLDGDPDTRWNDDSQRGVGAWLEFTFATPVEISEIEFQNVTDDEAFRRNYKIQGYTITVNDLSVSISGRLKNSNEPQRVRIASLETITLRIDVTSTHLAESVGTNPPWQELALQGLRFFGVEK